MSLPSPETANLKSSSPTALAAIMPARGTGGLFSLTSGCALSISTWLSPADERTLELPTCQEDACRVAVAALRRASKSLARGGREFAGSVDCSCNHLALEVPSCLPLQDTRRFMCARNLRLTYTRGTKNVIAAGKCCEESQSQTRPPYPEKTEVSVVLLDPCVRCWPYRRQGCRPMEPARVHFVKENLICIASLKRELQDGGVHHRCYMRFLGRVEPFSRCLEAREDRHWNNGMWSASCSSVNEKKKSSLNSVRYRS